LVARWHITLVHTCVRSDNSGDLNSLGGGNFSPTDRISSQVMGCRRLQYQYAWFVASSLVMRSLAVSLWPTPLRCHPTSAKS